jgi:hypothetical protein
MKRGTGLRSCLNYLIKLKLWCMRAFQASIFNKTLIYV